MDENNKGVIEEQDKPSENNPAPEVEGSENVSQETQTDQTQVSQDKPEEALSEEFPNDPEKQKQAFYAMRKKIKEYEENDKEGEEDISFLDAARGVSDPNIGVYQEESQGGRFDESDPATRAFLEEVRSAKTEAISAKREAMAARAQMEDTEAWAKYPQLNPKSTEKDKGFVADVEAQYILERNKAISLGRPKPKLVEVADKVQKRYEEIRSQAKEQGASEERVTQAQKEAASIEARGTTIGTANTGAEEIESLRVRARKGDIEAITELNKLTDPYISSME